MPVRWWRFPCSSDLICSQLYDEIWIPQHVYQEVVDAGLGRPGASALATAEWAARVIVAPAPDPLLVAELDIGEAEVISLARQLAPCTAVIDERRGRRIAQHVYGLPLRGTAGLLVEARRRGLVGDVRSALAALRAAGYFLADSVVDAACKAVGE